MGENFSLITFDEGEGLIHLYDEGQCAAAVAGGRVGPGTRITVYRSGKSTAMDAGSYPLFEALFAAARDAAAREAAQAITPVPAPAEPAEPEAEPRAPFVNEAAAPGAAEPVPAEPTGRAAPADPAPPPLSPRSSPPPVSPEAPSFRTFRNVVVGLLLALLVGWCVSRSDRPSAEQSTPVPTTSASDNMATPAVDPEADIPTQTFYALREVFARSGPGSAGGAVKIPRGTVLTGIIVSGSIDPSQNWLKVKIGPHSGRYVWTSNLGASSPPSLDPALAGERTVYTATTVRTEPREDAAPISGDSEISPGATLAVAGTVDSDWAEILLRRAGVGYVPVSVFDRPAEPVESTESEPKEHELLVSNRCPDRDFEIALYFKTRDGWQTNGGGVWSYSAGQSAYPTDQGRRIRVTSDTIYYAVTAVNGKNQIFDGETPIFYGDRRIYMRRAKIDVRSNGDYEIAFDC